MTKRVLVAMSGGVDSSLTAALLKEQGYAVEGVTMKLSPGVCCDIASAQAVCDHLKIPHRVLDAQESLSKDVIENFISEYRHGRTPNPCIRCNDLVKFHLLLEYAIQNKFDYLATGHYARVERDEKTGRFLLKKGIDEGKDQSYFLYRLTQEQMEHLLLPLGGYRKTDVRKRAKELNLPAPERPESQEICFVPEQPVPRIPEGERSRGSEARRDRINWRGRTASVTADSAPANARPPERGTCCRQPYLQSNNCYIIYKQ